MVYLLVFLKSSAVCLQFFQISRWHDKKPIWASAAQAGMNFSTYLWSRCDVKWHDVKTEKPSFCESIYRKDDSKTMFINMEIAIIHFQTGQADGAIVSKSQTGPVFGYL